MPDVPRPVAVRDSRRRQTVFFLLGFGQTSSTWRSNVVFFFCFCTAPNLVTAKESLHLAAAKQESTLRGRCRRRETSALKLLQKVPLETYRPSGLLTGPNDLNVLCGGGANRIKRREADHLSGPPLSDLLAAAITHAADKKGRCRAPGRGQGC